MREEFNWTKEQWDAIHEINCNLLVAAAAGAGKTAVLVERIIRRITNSENSVDIDRLLIMTFTNAAAAEMRERIAEAISAYLDKNPGSKNIQRQLTLLNKATITTIHSFCLEVVRSNFQYINIDPDFRIADETEAALMKLEVLNELFEEQYQNENPVFSELLECYGGNGDDGALQNMVLDLYTFIQSSPWPEKWFNEMTENLNPAEEMVFGITPWGQVLINSALIQLQGLKDAMSRAIEIISCWEGFEKHLEIYLEDMSNLNRLLKLCSGGTATWDVIYESLQRFEFKRLPTANKEMDRETLDYIKKIRDDVKDRIKTIKEKCFLADSAQIIRDMKIMYPVIKGLATLALTFEQKYAAKKSKKQVLDFNDLEHFCLEILTCYDDGYISPSKVALSYRERYAEILVDEYQDSNLLQESIINMVSKSDTGAPNVFMVGDVKQSIYRFRQAKPELFLDKYRNYSAEKGSIYRKILLFKNFRSRKEVVDAVNFIFKQTMSVNVGELDYTDNEALNPGADFAEYNKKIIKAGGDVELHLIDTGIPSDYQSLNDDEEMLDSIQCEARLVVKRIQQLMQPDERGRVFCVFDRDLKDYRKVDYRDIVILLRTVRNWSDIFVQELTAQGIPVFADTGTGFFKTPEVQVVLSLLQIIDNPHQDIPLLSVLRSPIASFSSEELAELRLCDRKASIFDALKLLSEQGQSDAAKKGLSFLRLLQRWRDMSLYMPTDQLLWHLYNETGYFAVVGAMPAGVQRQANLRVLFERARQFEDTAYKGLFNFVNFVDRLKSSRGDMGSAKILGENDNVIRIMSIHKSKGLEFPVVFLSGAGKKFNLQDVNKSVLYHQELGFGSDVISHRRRLRYPLVTKQAIREKLKAETLSEEMRILYVALTRAREKLLITGSLRDISKTAVKWAYCAGAGNAALPDYEMLKGTNYLDWLGPALLRHKDGKLLRDKAYANSYIAKYLIDNEPSQWSVGIWSRSDILSDKYIDNQKQSYLNEWEEQRLSTPEDMWDLSKEIDRRLSWHYPYQKLTTVPVKVSVTELKRRFELDSFEEENILFQPLLMKKPMFIEGQRGLSAAEAGTVLHFVLQHLDFYQKDISGQIKEMVKRELLTQQQAQSVDDEKIRGFLASVLGKRLLASQGIYREVPFNIEMSCQELYKDVPDEVYDGETVLLQGVIDCYFEEPEGIVLLDYKTDYAPDNRMEALMDKYRLQINYYARALEMLAGKRVKGKYIYLFWNGKTLEF